MIKRVLPFLAILSLLLLPLPSALLAGSYTNVTVTQAKVMIDSNPSLVILDVRTQSEYDSGHIRNAKLIPVTELESRLNELNKNDEILVYCKSGGRSSTASQILVNNGFLHVCNMLGGITAWTGEGYTVYVKYASIQEAINNANPGTTIHVSAGTYDENVVVNKTISLDGENKETTVIDGKGTGIVVHVTASNVVMTGFTMQDAMALDSGIRLEQNASNNTIHDNIMRNNDYGIWLHHSSGNVLFDNNATNNLVGIELMDSWNNTLYGNNIVKNEYGIYVVSSSNNLLLHNNFVNNTQQTLPPSLSANLWNNSCEGNFWSDYTGSDSDGDGVGETPYPIDGNNIDYYPLMNPYWVAGDVNHDLKVDIYDVVTITACYGLTSSDPDWNPHADIAEPYGTISIFDVVKCTSQYGEKYP